jgi:high-affinity Fe2+/Pb2+ permease
MGRCYYATAAFIAIATLAIMLAEATRVAIVPEVIVAIKSFFMFILLFKCAGKPVLKSLP